MKKIKLENIVDSFLFTFLIALTGFEYFYRSTGLIYYLLFFAFITFVQRKLTFNYRFFIIIIPFIFIYTLHAIFYKLDASIVPGLFLRFLTYYLVISVLAKNFVFTFVRVIYYICIISLFFYFTSLYEPILNFYIDVVSVNFHPLSGDANAYNNVDFNPNILLYTFNGGANEVFSRNSGPFWEPGMFTIFINIALLFSLILKNSILNKYSMVLLITNITTLSTTGYLAMFTTLFFIYLISTQKGTKKVLNYIFFLIILIVFILVWNLDFFGAKIINDLDVASEKGYSRFGAALIHFAQIQQSPWMGHGLNIREIDWKLTNSVTPNGLTNIIRTYGIPVSLFYYVLLYMSSKRIIGMITPNNKATFTFLLFFVLLILAFSQDITTRHLYLSFLFLSICIPKNLKIYQQ